MTTQRQQKRVTADTANDIFQIEEAIEGHILELAKSLAFETQSTEREKLNAALQKYVSTVEHLKTAQAILDGRLKPTPRK